MSNLEVPNKSKRVSAVQHLTTLRVASICLSQCFSNGSTRTTLAREEIYDSLFFKSRSHWPRGLGRGPAGGSLIGIEGSKPAVGMDSLSLVSVVCDVR